MSEPWKRHERIGDCDLYLGDCLEVMPALGTVDAVVADPPYGIGGLMKRSPSKKSTWHNQSNFEWDMKPHETGVNFLLSMGIPTIIWGGNYFKLPPKRGWLFWDKVTRNFTTGHCELAWTNLDQPIRGFNWAATKTLPERVGHPTQKPVALMEWCLGFLPNAETILDPFMGSGTTLVACAKLGRKGIGIELDPEYFDIACRRVEEAYRQPDLFVDQPKAAEPQQEGFDL